MGSNRDTEACEEDESGARPRLGAEEDTAPLDFSSLWDVERASYSHGAWRASVTSARGVRERQEDAFFVDLRRGLIVIADGMGGHVRGDLAARLSVHAVAVECERDRDPIRGLIAGFARAKRYLREEHGNLGTTLTACRFDERSLVVAHLGDTRAHAIGDELHQLTRDHNVAAEVGVPGFSHVLTACVSAADDHEPDLVQHPMPPRLLLTSDGAHGLVAPSRLCALLGDDPARAADGVVESAIHARTRDNATVIVLWRPDRSVA